MVRDIAYHTSNARSNELNLLEMLLEMCSYESNIFYSIFYYRQMEIVPKEIVAIIAHLNRTMNCQSKTLKARSSNWKKWTNNGRKNVNPFNIPAMAVACTNLKKSLAWWLVDAISLAVSCCSLVVWFHLEQNGQSFRGCINNSIKNVLIIRERWPIDIFSDILFIFIF